MTDEKKPEESQEKKTGEFADLDAEGLREMVLEFKKQKSHANKEAQKAKQQADERIAAMESELKKYQDKDRTEVEKLAAERDAIRAEFARAQAQVAEITRLNLAVKSGVTDPEYMAFQMARAQQDDATIDVDDWVGKFKEAHPSLFVNASESGSGGGNGASRAGGPAPGSNKRIDIMQEIKMLDDDMTRLRGDRFARDRDIRLFSMNRKKVELQKKLSNNK